LFDATDLQHDIAKLLTLYGVKRLPKPQAACSSDAGIANLA